MRLCKNHQKLLKANQVKQIQGRGNTKHALRILGMILNGHGILAIIP